MRGRNLRRAPLSPLPSRLSKTAEKKWPKGKMDSIATFKTNFANFGSKPTYTVGIPSYDVRGEEIPQKEANGTTETRGETHATRQIEGFCQGLRARLRVRPTRWQQRPRLLAYAYGTSRVGVAYKCIAARSSGCRAAGGLLQHRRLRRLRLRSVPHAFTRGSL